MRMWWLIGLVACSQKLEPVGGPSGGETDDTSETVDTNETEETGETEDTGDDSGDDTGVNEWGVDCDADYTPDPLEEGECFVQLLQCGDEVTGTTDGGTSLLGDDNNEVDEYTTWQCYEFPADDTSYEGTERIYQLVGLDSLQQATITLSYCDGFDEEDGRLSLFAARNVDDCDALAPENISISTCEGEEDDSPAEVGITGNGTAWAVVVEARDGQHTNYKLRVECD